jgi:endonuclease/exonuclease/phosphatase family metal-dependent hydrolase
MQIVSFNLQIFAAPPDTAFDDPPYSAARWAAKTGFVRETLERLKPDVVVFQEVFSVAALQSLCAELGLAHFTTAGVAPVQGPIAGNFVNAVNAAASRTPFLATFRVPFAPEVAALLDLPEAYDFSRPPVGVVVDAGALGPVTVVGVHLKSKRPDVEDVTYAPGTPWEERIRDTMVRQSAGMIRSLRRRGGEAAALYHHLAGLLTEDARSLVVMGDMNDGPLSVTMDALTMGGRVFRIGADGPSDWPAGTDRKLHALRLADAAILTAKPEGAPRRATHFHEGVPGVIDYALVSNALNPRNPDHRGRPERLRVIDAHIADPPRPNSTDHAILALTLEAKGEA